MRDVPSAEILLVSGLHANEKCAPLSAREVFKVLIERGERVALFEIPYPLTLLALIDDPREAVPDYCAPANQRLDMDLDALDGLLSQRYPAALVFEFHNSEDSQPILGIAPAKPVEAYQVGMVGPVFHRPYEIAVWRNVGHDGRPGKYLVELPARYVPVDRAVLAAREKRIAELGAEGLPFNSQWMHYLESVSDVEASRRQGYLNDCLAQRIADWIQARRSKRGA